MQKCIVLAAIAICVANGAQIDVSAGLDTLEQAILGAAAGDVLQLQVGSYGYLNDLVIDKQLTILGASDGETYIEVDSTSTPVVFRSTNLDLSLKELNLRDAATAGDCKLIRPIAMYAGLDYTLTAPSLDDSRVNIQASLGEWYDGRHIEDFSFANCLHSSANGDGAMDRIEIGLDATNCHGHLAFSVMFDQLISCGAEKSQTDESVLYDAPLKVTVSEYVEWETSQIILQKPDTRVIDAVSSVRVQLGRKFTAIQEGTLLSSNYEKFDFEMVVSQQSLPSVADALAGGTQSKVSTIELTLTLPSQYTITKNSIGDMQINAMANTDVANTASAWKLTAPECDDPTARYCRQTIEFQVYACELSGTYELLALPFQCQASAENCLPLEAEEATTDLVITLSSNDFCTANEVELQADFAATTHLMSDGLFTTAKDMSTGIVPDEILFVAIKLFTEGSGLVIENGAIVAMERGSDDEDATCEDHILPYAGENINKLVQNFIPQVAQVSKEDKGQPPQIHTEFMMNSNLACVADGVDYEARNLDMKYIISVTYTVTGGATNGFVADDLVYNEPGNVTEPETEPIEEAETIPEKKEEAEEPVPEVEDESNEIDVTKEPEAVPLHLRRRRAIKHLVRGRRLAADKEVDQSLLVKGKLADVDVAEVPDPTLNMMLYGIGGAFIALMLTCCVGSAVLYVCYRRQTRKINQIGLTRQLRGQMGKNGDSATNGMSGLSVFSDNNGNNVSGLCDHGASATSGFGAYNSSNEASPYPPHAQANMSNMHSNVNDSYDHMPALPYDDEPMGVDAYDSRPPTDGPNMKDTGSRFW
ncbi:hypothetical protein SARC_06640 [Sphaeroforma arctica JP610]|uniref:Uncharacterized protein n=1 Tax=Sphaeroforma arctica JP610 TaxID=667725 RepID=A0A0L0FWT6_9EUKA|nr:hypothetical protein SARC_06640 [Sphaeroforma arctica JP610]KNC81026.1 hypothetical protein SARC_06640 [Sphaeroforma arctica JP610]|eukprot:XP_014154928.1 hypothetical protein SARC_06640 [Sphaeroforma arctica JP610]